MIKKLGLIYLAAIFLFTGNVLFGQLGIDETVSLNDKLKEIADVAGRDDDFSNRIFQRFVTLEAKTNYAGIQACLKSDDPKVVGGAIMVLVELDGKKFIPDLLSKLDKNKPEVNHWVVLGLGKMGEDARSAMTKLSASEEKWKQLLAIGMMGSLGDKKAIAKLEKMILHKDNATSLAAMTALAKIDDKGLKKIISLAGKSIPTLKEDETDEKKIEKFTTTRDQAINALKVLKNAKFSPKLLKSAVSKVKSQALKKNVEASAQAFYTLYAIAPEKDAKKLYQKYKYLKDPSVQAAGVVFALNTKYSEKAFEFLMEIANGEDKRAKVYVARTLGYVTKKEQAKKLLELVKSENEGVKTAATKALKKATGLNKAPEGGWEDAIKTSKKLK